MLSSSKPLQQLKMAEIDAARQAKDDQAGCCYGQLHPPRTRLIPTIRGSPELFHPVRFRDVLIHRHRNDGLEGASIFLGEREKAKRLQGAGYRAQHLSSTQYRPGGRYEDQFDLRSLPERGGQRKQPAGEGNHLQFTGDALAVLEANDRRSAALLEVKSWRARM